MTECCGCPCLVLVASVALLRCRNVVATFGGTGKTATGLVTTIAILRSAEKYALLVTGFAADIGVRSHQRKASLAMVDLRASAGGLCCREICNQQAGCECDAQLQNRNTPPSVEKKMDLIQSSFNWLHGTLSIELYV